MTMEIHRRCISIIANLWKVPQGEQAIGTATTGSSEGVLLGGLAMKRRWQHNRKAQGLGTENPNIVFGSNAQVACVIALFRFTFNKHLSIIGKYLTLMLV